MVAGSPTTLLEDEPVERRHIAHVGRRPAIGAIADVSHGAFLPRDRDERRNEPLLDGVVDLREPDHPHVDARFQHRVTFELGCDAGVPIVRLEHVLRCGLARSRVAHPGSGGDDEGAVGSLERSTERLDHAPVLVAIGDEVREVMVEGGVDDRVRPCGTARDTRRIFELAAMRFGPGLLQPSSASVRAGQPDHLMARPDEFGHDTGADEPGRTGEEDTHEAPPLACQQYRASLGLLKS